MQITMVFWGVVAVVGLCATLGTGYLIVQGPFFGGDIVDPTTLIASLGGFIVGIIVLALGGSKLAWKLAAR